MRRLFGVMLMMALAAALVSSIARASQPSANDILPQRDWDIRAQLRLQLYGETFDSNAAVAASLGDRASESPLRDLALGVSSGFATIRIPAVPQASARLDLAQFFIPRDALGDRYVTPPLAAPSARATIESLPAVSLGAGAYQAPNPPVAPAGGESSFVLAPRPDGDADAASFALDGAGLSDTTESSVRRVSLHVGRMQFQGHVEGADAQAPRIALQDSAYGAGANFAVRAGERQVDVDVSSTYEHLMRDDTTAVSTVGVAGGSMLLGGDTVSAIPNYADVSKLGLGATVAVPVTRQLTFKLNYSAQRYLGAYGIPGLANLDASDNSLGGGLTFAIPRWSSAVSVSASQYRYQDNIAPANTFSDVRENVNFTVKF
jgi:hypothetical protein